MPPRKRHKRVPQAPRIPTPDQILADLTARAKGTPRRHK